MSRYFQQLERHAGLVPPSMPSLNPASLPVSVPQADITEEIVERDAVPTGFEKRESSTRMEITPQTPVSAQRKNEKVTPLLATDNDLKEESVSSKPHEKAKLNKPSTTPNKSESLSTPRPLPPSASTTPPDATMVLQHVMAWIAEPERTRDSKGITSAASPTQKDDPVSLDFTETSEVVESPALPPSASIQISPARTRATRPDSAHQLAKKTLPPEHAVSEETGTKLSQSPAGPFNKARRSTAALAPKQIEAAPEFSVSIGSIHLTVEAPPPPAPVQPIPVPPRPTSSTPTRSSVATRARRHYLRSI